MPDTQSKRHSFLRSFVEGELVLGFWNFAKKAAGALDSFLILGVFTLHQFGAYYLLLSLYAILSDFFHDVFGEVVGNDLARLIGGGEESKAKRLFREYALFRLLMAAIPWAALFFGAPLVAARIGAGDEVVGALRVMSFLFIADMLVALATMLLKLRLEFKILAPRATFQKLFQLAVLASFFFTSGLSLRQVFWAQLGGAVGAFLFMLPAVWRGSAPWRGMPAFNSGLFWPAVRSYGKWAVPQSFLTDFTGKVRPWLIRLFLNTEAVGIFGVAYTFFSALKDLLPIRTAGSLVPRRVGDARALERFYRYGTKYYVWLAALYGAGGALAVPIAIHLLFSQAIPAIPVFWLLLPGMLFFAFVKPMTFILVAFRRQRFLFLQSALQTAISLILLLALLPLIGIMGLAMAEALASAANAGVRYRYLVRSGLIDRFRFRSLATLEPEDRTHLTALFKYLFAALPGLRSLKR